MMISESPSPNSGDRVAGKAVSLLILHYTDTPTAFEALKIMQDPQKEVSAHYLVDDNGAILRLVPEERRAWHAGKSFWAGETDINSVSIGIEIQNPGHSHGYVPFPDAQIRAVTDLCRDICRRHALLPHHVLAHSDIAPARKLDPGELFPWKVLAAAGVSLWPEVTDRDTADAADILSDESAIATELHRYGYDPRVEFKTALTAFQRHFVPEVFREKTQGTVDLDTVSRLCALNRKRLELRPKMAHHR